MRQGLTIIVTCDIFLNSTCDMRGKKRQVHAILPILKIDMRHVGPPSRAPVRAGVEPLLSGRTGPREGL